MSVINRLTYTMRTLAGGAAIGLAVIVTSPAQAQLDAGAALANLTSPDYLHRDMQIFSQGLNLDDGQRMIVDALYQDYLDRFEAGWAATQEKVNGLRDDLQNLDPKQDQSRILETIFAPFEEWRTQKQQLKGRFESDVQAILGPAQSERWPQFQQQMTREKSLHLGRLSGEALNLFHLINDLRLSDRAYIDLQPVLDQYADELHKSLQERNGIMERGADEFIRGLRTQGAVPRPQYVADEIAARVRIRNINLRYLDVISERLPEQHVERFRSRALESAFPRVYRVLPAERMIKRALELEELDAETRRAIEGVRDQYQVEMNQLNQQLREVAVDFEPKQLRNQADREDARHTGATVERLADPARQMYTDREERSRYYMELVQSMLPADLAKTLPEGAGRADVQQQQRRARAASRNAKQQANEDQSSQPEVRGVGSIGSTGGAGGAGGRGGAGGAGRGGRGGK